MKLLSVRNILIIISLFFLGFVYIFFQQRVEIDFLEKKIKDMNEVLVFKIEQFNQEVQERKQTADRLKAFREELLSVKRENKALKLALEDRETRLDKAYPEFQDRIKHLNDNVDSLIKERRALNSEIKKLNKKIKSLSMKGRDVDLIEQENIRLKSQLREVETDYKSLMADKNILSEEIKDVEKIEKKISNLNIENAELKNRLNDIEGDRDVLARETNILRLTVAELKNRLQGRENELEAQRIFLDESRMKAGLQVDEVFKLEKSVGELIREREEILNVIAQKENSIEDKLDTIKSLETELKEAREQLQRQREEALSLSSENVRLTAELQDFKTRYKKINAALEGLSTINVKLQDKIGSIDHIFSESEKEMPKAKKAVVDLGSMKIDNVEPEIALTSMIYQLKKSGEYLSQEEQAPYLKREALLHYNLGVYYLKNDRFKEALDEFLESYGIIPDDPDTVYNIGLIYRYYIYDYEKARDYFTQYLKLNPASKDSKVIEKILKEISR